MRHAEFEECLAHDKYILELKKGFEATQSASFQYSDVRRDLIDEEVPRDESRRGFEELAHGPDLNLTPHTSRVREMPSPTYSPATPQVEQRIASPTHSQNEPAQEPTPIDLSLIHISEPTRPY